MKNLCGHKSTSTYVEKMDPRTGTDYTIGFDTASNTAIEMIGRKFNRNSNGDMLYESYGAISDSRFLERELNYIYDELEFHKKDTIKKIENSVNELQREIYRCQEVIQNQNDVIIQLQTEMKEFRKEFSGLEKDLVKVKRTASPFSLSKKELII